MYRSLVLIPIPQDTLQADQLIHSDIMHVNGSVYQSKEKQDLLHENYNQRVYGHNFGTCSFEIRLIIITGATSVTYCLQLQEYCLLNNLLRYLQIKEF